MVAILARFRISEGKEAEAEKALAEMASSVEKNEPGALTYIFHRSQRDPAQITVFEIYADDEAFKTHSQTDHMTKLRSFFGGVFDATTVSIDRLDKVAGFSRGDA